MNRMLNKIRIIYDNILFLIRNKKVSRDISLKNSKSIKCGTNCCIGKYSKLYCWSNYKYKNINQTLNGSIIIGNNFHATRNLCIQSCGRLIIGNDVLIASDVFICNYDHGMDNLMESYLNNELTIGSVIIEDGVWIGEKAIVLKNVTIGEHSIVGAGAVVTKSVPPYSLVVGNPARVTKKYNLFTQKWENANV